MGQNEGDRASLDGERRENNCDDGGDKEIIAPPWEDKGKTTNLSIHDDVNSNMTEVVVSLLPELISDILSRLPIEDVMRYRSVCKNWCALTKDSNFIQMHLSRSLCLPNRIILEPKVDDGPITSIYLIDSDGGTWRGRKIPVENIPGNYMFSICSCQGLLCVASDSDVDPLFIYNPITKECVELPRTDLKPETHYISVGFGFDHANKKYKLVQFSKMFRDDDSGFHVKGQIITVGEKSWRELQVSHTVICSLSARPVFLDGALHWVIDKASHLGREQILVLDLCNEKFRTINFPSSVIRSINDHVHVFLCTFGGSLCLVEHDLWRRFCLWRVERTNTKKGYKFYQSSYFMTIKYDGFFCSMKFLDKLMDNSFLFHVVVHLNLREMNENKDHLLIYFPEKDEYKVLEVLGAPDFFHPNFLVPSLVSPCDHIGN